jgi:hypothetical protein
MAGAGPVALLLWQDIGGTIEVMNMSMERVARWQGGTVPDCRNRFLQYATLAAAILMMLIVGCQSAPKSVPYARPYPELKQSDVLNIQVFRRTKTIEFTNTTARALGPSTIWLNERFCRPIDGLAIGQSMTLPMKEFRDEYFDAFRGGGFFAVEAPERLALAQIETTDIDGRRVMLGMIVVGGEAEE